MIFGYGIIYGIKMNKKQRKFSNLQTRLGQNLSLTLFGQMW